MSPKERQAWRDLVAHVPQWPPLPPGFIMPPIAAAENFPPQQTSLTNKLSCKIQISIFTVPR